MQRLFYHTEGNTFKDSGELGCGHLWVGMGIILCMGWGWSYWERRWWLNRQLVDWARKSVAIYSLEASNSKWRLAWWKDECSQNHPRVAGLQVCHQASADPWASLEWDGPSVVMRGQDFKLFSLWLLWPQQAVTGYGLPQGGVVTWAHSLFWWEGLPVAGGMCPSFMK